MFTELRDTKCEVENRVYTSVIAEKSKSKLISYLLRNGKYNFIVKYIFSPFETGVFYDFG